MVLINFVHCGIKRVSNLGHPFLSPRHLTLYIGTTAVLAAVLEDIATGVGDVEAGVDDHVVADPGPDRAGDEREQQLAAAWVGAAAADTEQAGQHRRQVGPAPS